jgi:hypothetical protein
MLCAKEQASAKDPPNTVGITGLGMSKWSHWNMGRGVRIGTVVAEWFGRPSTETKALSNLMVRSGK